MKILSHAFWVLMGISTCTSVCSQNRSEYPLRIHQMFDLAEKNSRSIRMYDYAEQASRQSVKVAKNALLPALEVSLSASYIGDGWMADRNFSHGMNAPMPHWGNNFAVEASQVLYAGGAIYAGIQLAELQAQLAQLQKDNNRQDIRFLLVGNYLELYKLGNQAQVYQHNIEQTNRLLTDIRARHAQGIALKNDITRYELQVKSLELSLVRLLNTRMILNHQLVTVLGLPADTDIQVDSVDLNSGIPAFYDELHWQDTVGVSSPLIRQAQVGVELSRKAELLTRAEYLPKIALFAGNKLDGPILVEVPPMDNNFNYWHVGIGLKYNLASLYTTGRKMKQARLATQKAQEEELLLRQQLSTQIKDDFIRLQESFTVLQTQTKSLELATLNYEVVNNRYLNDLALMSDMLDAMNAKLSAELEVANARVNILFSYYKLQKSIGNLS